jgi:hypothetical protein
MIQSKLNVCNALAGYMGVAKKAFADAAREQDDVTGLLRVQEVPQLACYHFYCSPIITRLGHELFHYDKFIKCRLYEEWLAGIGHCGENLSPCLIVVFKAKSTLMVLYKATGYTGIGGMFIRQEDYCGEGWCCEPLTNWLVNRVPKACRD